MKSKSYLINKFLIILLFLSLFQTTSHAENIKNFVINGNDRVSNETIIMFSNLEIGENISDTTLNKALKDLYFTDYFKNVDISFSNGTININVDENPIVQTVKITGIKSNNIYENIKKSTNRIEKYPFVESKINDQAILLKNILKSYGYYFVKLDTFIVTNTNNSVDLEFKFDLGDVAKIKKINFIGNKVFKDRILRNIVVSQEAKFWKFITKNKFLDTNRISLDISRLVNFYKNRGFYNVDVKSTTAVITDENQFELIFNINAGNKYSFGEVYINKANEIPIESIKEFSQEFSKLKNKRYSKKIVNNLIDEINDYTIKNEFIFVNANFKEIEKPNNKIDVVINFDDLEKKFIDRINILGNYITDEKVIRNSLIVDEGDPFNEILFDKSIQNIKSKNIFKSVDFVTKPNNELNKIIDIIVEEKPTGEVFAGAGTGTTGTSVTAGIKENNYLGLGIQLDTNFVISDDSLKGKFSVLNPNYNNSDKSLKTVLESSTNDFMSTGGYKTSRTGLIIGTEFEQMNDVFVNLEISNFYEDLETSSSANNIIKKQEGNYFENLISYSFSFNNLDQNFQPSDGSLTKFTQTLPIYSDDLSIENSLLSSHYHSVNDNLILSAKFYLKAINSIDDDVRVSKRVFVPSRFLRGFESGKIGPKDGSQFIGGNYASALNLNSTVPNIFFENENIDFNFFIDLANVWEVDYNENLDSNKVRSSTGFAVNWFSAIGPLTFSYAVPLSDADTDVTEKFRFQIGTSF